MNKIKIGILPLWLKLYDDCWSHVRPDVERFIETITDEYKKRGVEVVTSPICCLHPDFEEAIGSFEDAQVDAVITLHLAYSPSLESADVLAGTDLPIVILDTTQDLDFGFDLSCASADLGDNGGDVVATELEPLRLQRLRAQVGRPVLHLPLLPNAFRGFWQCHARIGAGCFQNSNKAPDQFHFR